MAADDRDRKLFAGTRIRRLRREFEVTQAQMAEHLGISTSYLNLLERNQRPLSAALLLRLAETYDIDVTEFRGNEETRAVASLKEVFSDPLFEGLSVANAELQDMVGASPAAAQAVVTLYRAYRDSIAKAAAMAEQMERRDIPVQAEAARFPIDEVRDFFDNANNHFPEVEAAAETLREEGGLSREDLYWDLKRHLKDSHDITVRIAPTDRFPDVFWQMDRHSKRLFLSEVMPSSGRTFQVAFQIGMLAHRDLYNEVVANHGITDPEVAKLCRLALANYFAGAVMMPYVEFLKTADKTRYDVDLLRQRFGASYEQVCHRLTTLHRPGARGVPFFFIRIDHAGNVSKRFSAAGFHMARFGGTCPRWNLHAAFRAPGSTMTQMVETEDGQTYFTFSRTVSGIGRGFGLPEQQLAIGMGCKVEFANKLVYAAGLDLKEVKGATPIGVNCRLCERADCNQRAFPPLNRTTTISEYHRGLSRFSFESF